jgi:hypothetical protein
VDDTGPGTGDTGLETGGDPGFDSGDTGADTGSAGSDTGRDTGSDTGGLEGCGVTNTAAHVVELTLDDNNNCTNTQDLYQLLAGQSPLFPPDSADEVLSNAIVGGDLVLLLEQHSVNNNDMTVDLIWGQSMSQQPDPECGVWANAGDWCDWDVAAESYAGECNAVNRFEGAIEGELFVTPPTDIVIPLNLFGNQPVMVPLQNVVLTAVVYEPFAMQGALCGELPKADVVELVDAICAAPGAPSFCALLGGGIIDSLLPCDPCGLGFFLDSTPGSLVGVGP